MKKIIVASSICFFSILFYLVVFGKENVQRYNNQQIVYNNYFVRSYQKNGRYTVLITEGNYVEKKVVFSSDRKIILQKNMKPIKNQDFSKFIGIPYSQIIEKLGMYHCDCGSGLFYPSYITQDGYLVMLSSNDNSNEIITSVIVIDLLSGEIRSRTGSSLGA